MTIARNIPRLQLSLALATLLLLGGPTGLLAQEVEWGYEGETGPEHWAALDPEFQTCATGLEQSPVDIPAGAPVRADDVAYDYQPSALTIADNGHAIQVDYDEGSGITIGDGTYALRQFHFHSPSEHTVDGEAADMELHLVHQDEAGALAVVGVLLVEGAANPALEPIWAHLPDAPGPATLIEGPIIDADDLLPADRSSYGYPGSLTTPPCLEGVTWHVLAESVELSAEQLATFREIHDGTNRPVQALNERSFEDADGG